MKIEQIVCHRYALPLARPLSFRGEEITQRQGLLLRVQDDSGRVAWGEIAPLPGFSRETFEQACHDGRVVCTTLKGATVPEGIEQLGGRFSDWLERVKMVPSVRFGIQTAILQLIAKNRNKPLRRILCETPRDSVTINALLDGNELEMAERARTLKEAGFTTFKIKVGRGDPEAEIKTVYRVRELIGPHARLRLDANRGFGTREARTFAEAVKDADIEYIEEPVRDYLELMQLTTRGGFALPVALDESLLSISPKALTALRGLKAIILKPTLLGFDGAVWFARRAYQMGLASVVSSAFESSLGLTMLASLAACLNGGATGPEVAAGLDTIDHLTEDLTTESLRIEGGRINLNEVSDRVLEVVHPSVQETPGD